MAIRTGTVIRVDIEGGFWGISTDDGEELRPIRLDPQFQVNGIRVRFEARDAAVFGLAQWGRPVRLDAVQLIPGHDPSA